MSLEQARTAFDAKSWVDAREAYAEAEELGARDLEQWGLAAFLTGQFAEAAAARERAHYDYLAEGDPDGASRVAFWLALTAQFRGDPAHAAGWRELMRSVQGERFAGSVWRGFELLAEAMSALQRGRAQEALERSTEVRRIASDFDDLDLRVFAGNAHGQALLANGEVAAGLAELDATMVLATGSPVNPQAVGIVYCAIVANCKECLDIERSIEWTAVLDDWCSAQPGLVPFQGACIVHRSEVHQFRGQWGMAIDEVEDLIAHPGPNRHTVGEAHYQRAELHRLRGEYDAAEAAYREALARGKDPQPGLALMRAAQGRPDSAILALKRAIEEPRPQQLSTRLWRALVDVALAAGDLDCASSAAARLEELVTSSDAVFPRAAAAMARGSVALAAGRPQEALASLRPALDGFHTAGSPYDVARSQAAIAKACELLGDRETARFGREAARAAFASLRALPDLDALDAATKPDRHGLTPREVEILGLLATGATNRGIAEALVLSEKTVARHVANVFAKLDVSNRAAATAWAHQHGLS